MVAPLLLNVFVIARSAVVESPSQPRPGFCCWRARENSVLQQTWTCRQGAAEAARPCGGGGCLNRREERDWWTEEEGGGQAGGVCRWGNLFCCHLGGKGLPPTSNYAYAALCEVGVPRKIPPPAQKFRPSGFSGFQLGEVPDICTGRTGAVLTESKLKLV